jgi:hypothetical protein
MIDEAIDSSPHFSEAMNAPKIAKDSTQQDYPKASSKDC